MSLFDLGDIAGGVVGAIGGIIDSANNYQINKENLEFQKEQYEYNKNMQNKIFNYQQQLNNTLMEREDTAVQRRAKDLEAAGMSKWLAAGNGAQSSVASSGAPAPLGNAPQNNYRSNLGNIISDTVSIIGALKSHNTLESQSALNEANADKAEAEAENVRAKTDTEINNTRAEIESRTDLNRQQKKNLEKQIDEIASRTELNRANTSYTKTGQTKLMNEVDLIRSQIESNNYDNIIKDYNLEWSRRRGIRTSDPANTLERQLNDLIRTMDSPGKNKPGKFSKFGRAAKMFRYIR